MKLFYKIYSWLIVGTVILLAVEGYINYLDEISRYRADMKDSAILTGAVLSKMISHTWKEAGVEKALQLIKDADEIAAPIDFRWVWIDAHKGEMHAPMVNLKKMMPVKEGKIVCFETNSKNGDSFLYTYAPVKLKDMKPGAIEITQSLVPLNQFRQKLLYRSVMIAFLLLMMSGFLLYYLFDRLIRKPVNLLSHKAHRVGAGDLSPDLNIKGNDELSQLASTLNDMCKQLSLAKETTREENEKRIAAIEQLRHVERLATIGRLSAGMAHEIGTPLNVVAGRAKMIETGEMSEDEIESCARIIREQVDRISGIMKQLLSFSRNSKPSRSMESIESLLTRVIEMLHPIASKNGVDLITPAHGNLPKVYMDPSQIQQVLINIMMNGVQSMPRGGHLELKVHTEIKGRPYIQDLPEKEYLVIDVKDEGKGIPKTDIRHVFDPFFTTKEIGQGTGLGLSIAFGIMEEHNGWIEVSSESGKGTCFSIFLPMEA